MAYLSRTLKPQSIKNYLNIIRLMHLEAFLCNPLKDNYALSNLQKGIARLNGCAPKQMRPITAEMLFDLSKHLCMMIPKDLAFWAVCCVGLFGFLRKATLLPISATSPGDACLLKGDLELIGYDSFVLHVRRTKTIQYNERVLKLVYAAGKGSILCPVSAVRNLMYLAPNDATLPLFSFKHKGKLSWWTHSTFTAKLRELLSLCGYPAGEYSCHSFRRGGATLAFRLGMSITQIKKRGDWRSAAVEQYVWVDERQDFDMASKLVKGAFL